jgi:hypothetical protein
MCALSSVGLIVVPRADGYLIVTRTSKKQVLVLQKDGEVRYSASTCHLSATNLVHLRSRQHVISPCAQSQVLSSLRMPSESDDEAEGSVAVSRCGTILGVGNEKGEVHIYNIDRAEVCWRHFMAGAETQSTFPTLY